MSKEKIYDYIVIGSGIAGACISYELSKYTSSILILEKNSKIASEASGAAGGFLSPLLGKPNKFKDLINNAFRYSATFYKQHTPKHINQCGTLRIPKNKNDEKKFKEFIPFIDEKYKIEQGGCFFADASIVNGEQICINLIGNIDIQYNTEVKNTKYEQSIWNINDKYYTKNIIIANGADEKIISEFYIKTRNIWGTRVDISTTTCIKHNYHKECSVSLSEEINEKTYKISIGATHHRDVDDKKVFNNDTQNLLKKADDILKLDDVKVTHEYIGARCSSIDYFPIVGEVIDSEKTIKEFPYLKKGTKVQEKRFTKYKNLYILNALGGRGFVLAPYLAKQLVDLIINDIEIIEDINTNRLFKREVKRL